MTLIKDFTAVHYSIPGWKKRNLVIILHSMDGTYQGTISWFRNKDSGGSTQYLISKDGEIRQMVKDEHSSWNCMGMTSDYGAKAYWNDISLSIELEDEKKGKDWVYPQKQRDALVWLCNKLSADYQIPKDDKHILLHKNLDPARRSDPVGNFDLKWILEVPMAETELEKLRKEADDARKARDTNWNLYSAEKEAHKTTSEQLLELKEEVVVLQDSIEYLKTDKKILGEEIIKLNQKIEELGETGIAVNSALQALTLFLKLAVAGRWN